MDTLELIRPAAQRAAQAHEDRALAQHLGRGELAAAYEAAIRSAVNDTDCATVLRQLMDDGTLDAEETDEMVCDAAAVRLARRRKAPLPSTTADQRNLERVLRALDGLIAACDDSTDRSTLLQGAKAAAYTIWAQCGGSLVARHG